MKKKAKRISAMYGHWSEKKSRIGLDSIVCSVCGREAPEITDGGGSYLLSAFCPYCGAEMDLEDKPCIYKHTCGFDYCNLSECPYYEPKTTGRKWAEQEEVEFDYAAEDCTND